MRRAVVLVLVLSCARNLRSRDPRNWLELQSEHFSMRTDLPEPDARRAIADFELVRAALLEAGWKSNHPQAGRTQVVEFAFERELHEFARQGIEGFVTTGAFGDPLMVVSGGQDIVDQHLVKHELTHVINGGFLVSRPRWVDEGIACYLETLRFDRSSNQVVIGNADPMRLEFLSHFKTYRWTEVISTGRDFESMSAEAGYGFETQAWLLVHWLADEQPEAFERFVTRLARGENQTAAFSAEFPGFDDARIEAKLRAYSHKGELRYWTFPVPVWNGPVAVRSMSAGEMFALRAELASLGPGDGTPASRQQAARAELAMALAVDPGEPLALELMRDSDGAAAVSAHPGDWRSWVLRYDRGGHPLDAIDHAFRLAPENAGVLYRLAFAELERGKLELAQRHAASAAETAPGRSDVLDAWAQVLSANGRCHEAHEAEQRAINALPDQVSPDAPAALQERLRQLDGNCRTPQPPEQPIAQQPAPPSEPPRKAVSRKPVLRSCRSAPPQGDMKGALVAEFTIGEDGGVSAVTVKGEASQPFLAAFKRYMEGCQFEPVVVDGRPRAVRSSTTLTRARGRR